ncbi:MAG: M23 family peptidase [Chloroflexi bacterium]|nr:MAG: M23 family peptidase [Chloroflexota bacterium]
MKLGQQILFFTIIALAFVAGCTETSATTTPTAIAVATNTAVSPTNTPSPTHTPTNTPTSIPTNTPTPTATPTATAVPITVSGDPYAAQLQEPEKNGRYPCGAVDTFDFPIDPPHGTTARWGGSDFGIYRRRYDQYHAGEDWSGPAGSPNLGSPVYNIGHGLVTYAEPNGWGRDKGVVIVQHTFADRRQIYSFYGHLDPESIVLNAGECVVRGEQVGNIGQPRTPPHLHFEIRTHEPYKTLGGYWFEDPTLGGWLPPSQTIWQQRIAASPGVDWLRPFTHTGTDPIGQLNNNTFLIYENKQLIALNATDGSEQPLVLDVEAVDGALVHEQTSTLFIGTRLGQITAFALSEGNNTDNDNTDNEVVQQWTLDLGENGTPEFMPLPNGGLIVAIREELFAVSANGRLLWQANMGEQPFSHTLTPDALYFTTSGNENSGVWQVVGEERPLQLAPISGKLTFANDHLWIYATEGVYRLNPSAATPTLQQLYLLPRGFTRQSDIIPLTDGGVIIAHTDLFDSRLLTFTPDGTLNWERSLTNRSTSSHSLRQINNQLYLITHTNLQNASQLSLFAVNSSAQSMTHLFTGGTRAPHIFDDWAAIFSNRLLLNIGGGHLVQVDGKTAVTNITLPES